MSIMSQSTGAATVESLKVLLRIRPDSPSSNNDNILVIDEVNNGISLNRDKKGSLDFKFSGVLGPNSTQLDVYKHCNSVINGAVDGVNTCIMAYGQTGSGKTFSMYGKGFEEQTSNLSATTDSNDNDSVHDQIDIDSVNYGIIPRAIQDLFASLDKTSSSNDSFDFSDKRRENPLQIRESERGSFSAVHVRGLSIYRVYSKDDVMALLRKGIRNRATRATDFNQESSRSHTILQLFIQVEEVDANGILVLKRSTLSLVDLAGSEKWRPSLGVAGNSNIDVQKEMTNINSSLHVLGNCVSALIESGRKHIPYRDSTLTRLLQDSLSGNGRTVLLATIREDPTYREETYSTLQFASRASKIKVTISVSQGVAEGVTIDEARKQILVLKNKLSEAQNYNNSSNDRASQGEISELKACVVELKKQMLSLWDENNKLREKCGMTKIFKPVILADFTVASPSKGNQSPQHLPSPLFLPEYKDNCDASVKSDDISEVSLQSLTSLTNYPGDTAGGGLEDSDNSLTKEVNFVNNIILNNAVASDDIVMPQLNESTNSPHSTIPKSPSKSDLKIMIPISPVNERSNAPFAASPIVRTQLKMDDVAQRSAPSTVQIQTYQSNTKPSSGRSNVASTKRSKRVSSKSGKRSSSKNSRGSASDAYDSESGFSDRGDIASKKSFNTTDETDNKPKSSQLIGGSKIEAALAAARMTLSQPAITFEEEVANRVVTSPTDNQSSPGTGSYKQGYTSPEVSENNGIVSQPPSHVEVQSDRMAKLQSVVAKEFPENSSPDNMFTDSNNPNINTTSAIMNKIQEQRNHRVELQETMLSGNSYNQPNPYSNGAMNYQFKPALSSSPPIHNDIRFDRPSAVSSLSHSNSSYSNPTMTIKPVKPFDFSEPCQKHGLEQCILCQMFGGVNMTTQSQSLISNDDILGNSNDNLSDFESINSYNYNSSSKPKGATILRTSHSEDMLDEGNSSARASPTILSRRMSPITTSSSFLSMSQTMSTAKRIDPTVCQTHGVNDCLLCAMRENNSFNINNRNTSRSFGNQGDSYTNSSSGGMYNSNNYASSISAGSNYTGNAGNSMDAHYSNGSSYSSSGGSQINKLSSKALLSYSDPAANSYSNYGSEVGSSSYSKSASESQLNNLSQYRPASLAKVAFLPPEEQSQQSSRQYLSPLMQTTHGGSNFAYTKHSAPSVRPTNVEYNAYNTYSTMGSNHTSSNATRMDGKSIPNHPHSAHSRLEHTSNTIVLESKRGIHYEDTNPILSQYSDQDDTSDYRGEESDNTETDYGIDKDRTLAVTHTPSLPSIASNRSLSSMGSNNAEPLLQPGSKAKVMKKKKKVKSGRR